MKLQQSPVLGPPCLQQCGLKDPGAAAYLCSWWGPALCPQCPQLRDLPPAASPETQALPRTGFHFPALSFLAASITSCFGSSEIMSHFCHPPATSGPYRHPPRGHYVTSLPVAGILSSLASHVTPATISLLLVSAFCHPLPLPPLEHSRSWDNSDIWKLVG